MDSSDVSSVVGHPIVWPYTMNDSYNKMILLFFSPTFIILQCIQQHIYDEWSLMMMSVADHHVPTICGFRTSHIPHYFFLSFLKKEAPMIYGLDKNSPSSSLDICGPTSYAFLREKKMNCF